MDIQDSYVALCFDQAVGYLGTTIEADLEQAGNKPSKGEGKVKMARERILKKYFGEDYGQSAKQQQFSDPAALFS